MSHVQAIYRDAAERHGTTAQFMKTLCAHGFARVEGSKVLPARIRTFHLREDETVDAFKARLPADFPALTAENAQEFHDLLKLFNMVERADHPDWRMDQAAAILRAANEDPTINPVTAEPMRKLIGGDRVHVGDYCRRKRAQITLLTGSQELVAAELGIAINQLEPLLALGLLNEVRGAGHRVTYDVEPGQVRRVALERFAALRPAVATIPFVNHYHVARRRLELTVWEEHPEGLVHAVVDMLILHKQQATLTALHGLLAGDVEQLHGILLRRHRERGDVPFPRRMVRASGVDLERFRASLPEPLRHAPRTAMDGKRASAKAAPKPDDMTRVGEIEHPRLAAVAAVVALHGRITELFHPSCRRAMRALHELWPSADGLDIGNQFDVSSWIEALRIVALGSSQDERWTALQHILAWKAVVEIFDDYRTTEGLEPDLVAYLDSIAPVLPYGADDFFKKVLEATQAITDARYVDRVRRLDDLLENVGSFSQRLVARRRQTIAFRAAVRAAVAEAVAEGRDHATFSIEGRFVEVIARREGEPGPRERIVTFRVHSWEHVLACVKEHRSRAERYLERAEPEPKWKQALFESRYAVENVSCLHEDGTPAEEPYWFSLHEDRLFWVPRCCTQPEFERRCAALAELGWQAASIQHHGVGLANFEQGRFTLARAARDMLGWRLLPLDEHNHAEAFAIYHTSMRLDEPLRTDEIAQFNLGEGAIVDIDADGNAYTTFSAYTKMKPDQAEFTPSPQTEAFADELLALTRERRYGGAEIPDVRRTYHKPGKGPIEAPFLFAYGEKTLNPQQLTTVTTILCAKIQRIRPHDLKYMWNRLEAAKGAAEEELQEKQQHTDPKTTRAYNPRTSGDRARAREVRRQATSEQRTLLDGRAREGSAQPSGAEPDVERLWSEKRRLALLIAFYEEEDRFEELEAARRDLARVVAAIGETEPKAEVV